MEIRAAVVERGEQKARVRGSHHPVPDAVAEAVFLCVVGQAGLGQIHRADADQDVFIDFVGGVLHLQSVPGAAGHIVGIVNYQDQIVAHKLIGIYNVLIELLQQFFVLQFAVPEAQQQFLGAALLLGFQGKLQGVQILADGEGFSENFKILEHLLLGQSQERLPKLGLLIFLPVHIAAAYAGDGAVVLGEKFLDFRYFLFYHMYLVSAYVRRALQWEYLLLGKVKCRKPGEVWVLRHCKMGRSAEF